MTLREIFRLGSEGAFDPLPEAQRDREPACLAYRAAEDAATRKNWRAPGTAGRSQTPSSHDFPLCYYDEVAHMKRRGWTRLSRLGSSVFQSVVIEPARFNRN